MPRARLADVAARAGVSTATVSLVLRGRPGPGADTRALVESAAAELDYRPDRAASLLATRSSAQVGVLFDVRSTFHAHLVDVFDTAAGEAGLDLVLATRTARRDERGALEVLLDSRCSAMILLGTELPDADLASVARDVPTVVVGRREVDGVTCVTADEEIGVGLAVDHLHSLGHERITFVDGLPRTRIATVRRQAYRAAMRRHGLADLVDIRPGGADEAAGMAAGASLVAERLTDDRERPTALVCFNDYVAVGARVALARGGVAVPGQISVVGYDDSPIARLATVDLTSVSQQPEALAARTMRSLRQQLDDDATVEDIRVEPALVVRSTTGVPPT